MVIAAIFGLILGVVLGILGHSIDTKEFWIGAISLNTLFNVLRTVELLKVKLW